MLVRATVLVLAHGISTRKCKSATAAEGKTLTKGWVKTRSGRNSSNSWLLTDSLRTAELEGADLRNDVVSEGGVFGHSVRESQGDKSDEALDFMDHSICVGHLGPVSHTGFS